MNQSKKSTLTVLISILLTYTSGVSVADQVIKTLPGGDGTEILANPKNPGESLDAGHGGGTIVVDQECAQKTKKASKSKTGKINPAYEACVKDKLEKAMKKGEH
jgi:hypothetical protein